MSYLKHKKGSIEEAVLEALKTKSARSKLPARRPLALYKEPLKVGLRIK